MKELWRFGLHHVGWVADGLQVMVTDKVHVQATSRLRNISPCGLGRPMTAETAKVLLGADVNTVVM